MNIIHAKDWEVRALLEGRKTTFTRLQTADDSGENYRPCPWTPGPVAIKETFCFSLEGEDVRYLATWKNNGMTCFWKSSLTMPQWAIRPAFQGAEITRVWVCRLGEMTEDDALSDGILNPPIRGLCGCDDRKHESVAQCSFYTRWNHDNPSNPWRLDLMVWRCEVILANFSWYLSTKVKLKGTK